MTALTETTNRPLAKTASDECSPELWRQLTNSALSWGDACAALAADPKALAELRTRGGALIRHAEPCGSKAVVSALAPLVTLYGVQDRSEAEWTAFWRFYLDALGDLPAAALTAGIAEYVGNAKSEFFPKPGPLKAICDRHAISLRMAASRARKALEIAS